MPRDGSFIYHRPPGTDGIPDTSIESTKYNAYVADIEQDLNLPRPIIAGGTGANNAVDAMKNLGGEMAAQIVTNYDTFPFVSGSFYSAAGATGAPNSINQFYGVAVVAANPNLVTLSAWIGGASATGVTYIREKVNTWGPWTTIASPNDKVSKVGDTMTGDLILNRSSTNVGAVYFGTGNNYLVWDGAGFSFGGGLLSVATPTGATHATSKGYVDTAVGAKVNRSGDTMAGHLSLPTAPSATNAVRKDYVDAQDTLNVAKAGDTMTGPLTVNATIATTAGYSSGGKPVIQTSGGYTVVYDNTSFATFSLGNGADQRNYYDQEAHLFRSRASVQYAVFQSTGTFNVSGAWTAFSGRELKQDVVPYTRGLDAVRELNPVMFRYRPDTPFARSETEPSEPLLGFVAEEVEPHVPEIVGEATAIVGKAQFNVATLEPGNLIYALTNAIKELAARLDALHARIKELEEATPPAKRK